MRATRITCTLLAFIAIVSYATASESAGEEFLAWAIRSGASAPKIKVAPEADYGGYGVRTTAMIRKGEEIVRLPQALVLNRMSLPNFFEKEESNTVLQEARNSLIWGLQRIDRMSNGTNNEAHVLSFFILFNKCQRDLHGISAWIDILPNDFHNPVHFDDETMELLRGSDLYDAARRVKTATETFWQAAVEPAVNVMVSTMTDQLAESADWHSHFDLEAWKWAMSVVSSRAAFIPNQGLSICMLADVFNHRPHQGARQPAKQLAENGDLVIVAQQTYPAGAPVVIDYGTMTSADFLQLYGFVDEESEHESLPFWFSLAQDDPFLAEKDAFLVELGYRSELMLPMERRPSKELMFYLRLLKATGEEFAVMQKEPKAFFHAMVSPRNEAEALEYLLQVAEAKLRRFPTDVESDINLLAGEELTTNERNAIEVRLRQKQTLFRLLSYGSVGRQKAMEAAAQQGREGREEDAQRGEDLQRMQADVQGL